MKALVTGGAGFIGTNLIKRLLKDGHEVVSVDNYSTGKKENHQEGCQYHDFDLSSSHTLGIYVDHGSYPRWRDDEYDVIFHMAALARIQPSIKNPHKTLFNNFVSTLNILDYVRRKNEKERWANKIKVVYAGSSSVHHGLYGSPYAWSKFSGEDLCKLYSNVYDMGISICRFYNVYGPHQITGGTYATMLGIFEQQYRKGKPLTITGSGEQRRDFTHVDDIVDGLVKCGDGLLDEGNSVVSGEIFELGRGVNYSVNEVVDMFGKDYPREYIPKREGEYDVTLADYSHANDLLNWKPTRNIEDYIQAFVETEKFFNE
jgi:UDP-glucose 4-epimerase